MYVHVLYNKIHLLKNLRMKQPVQVNPGLNCSFSYEKLHRHIFMYYTNARHPGSTHKFIYVLYNTTNIQVHLYCFTSLFLTVCIIYIAFMSCLQICFIWKGLL